MGSYHTAEIYIPNVQASFSNIHGCSWSEKPVQDWRLPYLQCVVQVHTHTYIQLARVFRPSVRVYSTVRAILSWGFPELGEVWTHLSSGHHIHRLSHLSLCWPEHTQPLWLCSSMIRHRTRVYWKKWHAAFQNNVIWIQRKKKKNHLWNWGLNILTEQMTQSDVFLVIQTINKRQWWTSRSCQEQLCKESFCANTATKFCIEALTHLLRQAGTAKWVMLNVKHPCTCYGYCTCNTKMANGDFFCTCTFSKIWSFTKELLLYLNLL